MHSPGSTKKRIDSRDYIQRIIFLIVNQCYQFKHKAMLHHSSYDKNKVNNLFNYKEVLETLLAQIFIASKVDSIVNQSNLLRQRDLLLLSLFP